MIDKIQQHFGFAQMPFGRDLTPAAPRCQPPP